MKRWLPLKTDTFLFSICVCNRERREMRLYQSIFIWYLLHTKHVPNVAGGNYCKELEEQMRLSK